MNTRIICIDGPKKGREYFFPEEVRQFQVNAVKPDFSLGGMGYFVGVIYRTYHMWGTGVRVGMVQWIAERGAPREYNEAEWTYRATPVPVGWIRETLYR
jgi:hypothetical protein